MLSFEIIHRIKPQSCIMGQKSYQWLLSYLTALLCIFTQHTCNQKHSPLQWKEENICHMQLCFRIRNDNKKFPFTSVHGSKSSFMNWDSSTKTKSSSAILQINTFFSFLQNVVAYASNSFEVVEFSVRVIAAILYKNDSRRKNNDKQFW